MLLVVFEEFQMVYIFLLLFSFSLPLSTGKRSTSAKLWGSSAPPPPHPPAPLPAPLVSMGLPSKEKFYSLLRRKKISDKGYKHVFKIWNKFEMKTKKEERLS